MIISRGRGYVFVHIPKTGGTSLAEALEQRAMRDDILIGDTPKALRRKKRLQGVQASGRLWKHSKLSDIDGVLSPQEVSKMFTFTLVRNPWDRMVSYYHWLRVQRFDHPAVALSKGLSFGEFVQNPTIRSGFAQNTAPQYMTTAAGVECCSAYIRLENFEEDAAPLFDHLGFEIRLPHLNRSDRAAGYHGCYDDKARAAVAEVCQVDVERFGYRF